MRIVYIDDFFHPDAGYHINLLSKYWALFGNEVHILTADANKTPEDLKSFFDYNNITAKDNEFENKNNVSIHRIPIWGVYSGRAFFKKEIFRTIERLAPDIVYCNGNDSLIGMQLTLKSRKAKYGLVLDSHMLEIASTNRFKQLYRAVYKHVFASIIIKEGIPVIRTQDDPYIEKCLGIPLKNSPLISFGSDTLIFHPDTVVKKTFRDELNIGEKDFVVVYAGKLNAAKGLEFLKESIKKKLEATKKIIFLIVGSIDSSITNQEEFFSECDNTIIRFPTQKYVDLPKFYQVSDIAIFPKQCSLSFYDVQACGLPVVFENNDLNKKRAGHNNAIVFNESDVEDFRNKILFFANMSYKDFEAYSENAVNFIQEEYNYADKAKEYISILESRRKGAEKK